MRWRDVAAKSSEAVPSLMLDRSFPQLRDEAPGHTRPASKATDARLAPVTGLQGQRHSAAAYVKRLGKDDDEECTGRGCAWDPLKSGALGRASQTS